MKKRRFNRRLSFVTEVALKHDAIKNILANKEGKMRKKERKRERQK